MNVARPDKIVVFGLMSHFPVAGVVWQTIHYLIGLQRLGYDVYYVEVHGCSPTKLMNSETDDGPVLAANYISEIMNRFGVGDRWALDTRYDPRRFFGMTELQLKTLYADAALLINLSGGTLPLPEHVASDRLIFLETDPVEVQIDLLSRRRETIEFLEEHRALFSYGENLGKPECLLPSTPGFKFLPTRQPVVLDFWETCGSGDAAVFTTVGNWNQPARPRRFKGEMYTWSKHFEFLKFIDLPSRTTQPFELALSSYDESDREMLESKGWRVRHALDISSGLNFEAYRDYIGESRGEFTVAKDQNIRLRSGWFSDRAAAYLAAGRPVITQETGFSGILPTGEGLFAFSTIEEILEAVEAVNADYPRHRRAALRIAEECFRHDLVLTRLLADVGAARLQPRPPRSFVVPEPFFPPDLVLSPTRRWPTRLPEATVNAVMRWPVPAAPHVRNEIRPRFSIVIVVFNGLVYTRMCLTSLLLSTRSRRYEVIVVDNASTDGTPEYLREIADANPHLHVVSNPTNRGYAAANNQGLAMARGDTLVLLNNDTIVTTGWLGGLARALADRSVGLVGPVTNRTCNEAEIDTSYRTYGDLCTFVRDRCLHETGLNTELSMLAFFCVAMRRDVFELLGPLDERFGLGSFEDSDYCMRAAHAGYRLLCSEGVFVHHFGQATIGELCGTGEYDELYQSNRLQFEEKWGDWKPPKKRITPEYEGLRARIRDTVVQVLPPDTTIVVISKGDDQLLCVGGRHLWHFPQTADGAYRYVYPADSTDAIRELETLREKGASHLLLPSPGLWWLEYYSGLATHLGAPMFKDGDCAIFSLNHD